MKKTGDRFKFYATDVCNFVACPHLTHLDRFSFTQNLKKTEIDAQAKMITDKGKEHEARYLAFLKSSSKSVYEIERIPGASPEEESERTLEALKQGHDYVYQAALCHGLLAGYADFLARVDTKSDLGNFSYEVIDSKLGNKEKSSHLIQLCFYSDLLATLQGKLPVNAHIYPGTRQLLTFRVTNFFDYYQRRRDQFLKEFAAASSDDLYPEPCAQCSTCHWRDHCKEKWNTDDHLSLVANITKGQRKHLGKAGITTVNALATASQKAIEGISPDVFTRLREQASLQVHSRTHDNTPSYKPIAPKAGVPGFALLPDPQEGDLFYDIEGDPLVKEEYLVQSNPKIRDGLEYLHGFSFVLPSGKLEYACFWARSKAEEAECYDKLLTFLVTHTTKYPNAKIYHYSAYETSALKRLSSQYPTRTEELDNLLRDKKFVDLYQIVKQSVRVSEPRYSIKNLERFYSEKRDLDVKDGGASVVWFEQYLETGDESKLKQIEEYNKKDCDSTYELFMWLHQLKKESTKLFSVNWKEIAQARAAHEEEKKNKKKEKDPAVQLETADERIRRYAKSFGIQGLQSKDAELRTESDNFQELLFYLADFFRREMKPTWWQFYRWQENPTEMFEHPDCLGSVTIDASKPLGTIARSHLIHYTFPAQETKLGIGDDLFDTLSLESYGSIHHIDTDTCSLQIKLGKSRDPRTNLELVPDPNQSVMKLITGLDSFLGAMTETPAGTLCAPGRKYPHQALVDILRKLPPTFTSAPLRDPIVSVSASDPKFPEQLLNAALDLDNSYLFIQGPPGTGKTYHGARLATSLMARGKKIAVTSNSHKAIINLLQEIDSVAHNEGFSFRGLKKADKAKEHTHYTPQKPELLPYAQIVNCFENDQINPDTLNLLAGTAWTFVKKDHYQKFDYLIVDEASQLSLAHLIAAGVCAKNLILIGDPQQLPQPLQGVHPGDLSLSPLEYLLEGKGTVPPHMGIFLDVCRRMHTDICGVLSKHVYDDRLKAPEENGNQRIPNPTKTLIPKESGILFYPCEHEGNTSSAPEEVAQVRKIFNELLTCSFRDKEGGGRALTEKDIMVIAPYNIQVNNLRSALGKNAEVGTIDLFQGREAPVVIISMTASNPEETPRGIDFLFSQQRINVALSRAKALAIIVGSPKLFSTKCNNARQMELVNFFCALSS